MNKFILVLLIVAASSVKIEFDGSNLESWWPDWGDLFDWDWWCDKFESIWGSIKSFFSDIPGYLGGIYKQLTDQGIVKTLMGIVEKYGKPKAIEYCKDFTGSDGLCSGIVDFIFNKIKSVTS